MIDVNSQFFAILTNVGMAKQANADALGVPWKITEMGVGDANGTDPIPNAAQTKLINEWRRRPLNQLKVDPVNPAVIIAEQIIPADEGGKWIREIGLYDVDGDLIAVANCAPSFKPILSQGSGRTQIVRMNFIVTSAGNITLKIDPAIVLASRAYVDAAILEVLPANKAPGVYRRVTVNNRGLVVSGDNPETLAGFGIKDTYTKPEIEAIVAQASALPVGSMVPFPVNKVPPGFLEIDGSVQSIATYPDLAALLGTAFNQGNEGAGNFRLPESRGEFLRGWDHGRGVDAGRAIGSKQLDALQGHRHATNTLNGSATDNPVQAGGTQFTGNVVVGDPITDGTNGAPRVAAETRPRNMAVMWCLKAWNAPINQGNIDIAALAAEVQTLRNLAFSRHKGLFVSATGTNAQLAIKARRLIVGDGGLAQALDNVDLGINLATVGLGGLDAGVLAASSWYSGWVATNGATRAGIAALMPSLIGATTTGSPVVTGLASTVSMRAGMPFGGAPFPPGTVVKSVDSPSQITASQPAISTAASAALLFMYEPVLPTGYSAVRVTSFFTDTTNKYPLRYRQRGRQVKWLIAPGTNVLMSRSVTGGIVGTWSATAPVWAEASLVNFVPITAVSASFTAISSYNGTAQSNICIAPSAAYLGSRTQAPPPISTTLAGGTGAAPDIMSADIMLESMSVFVVSQTAAGAVVINGYEDDV